MANACCSRLGNIFVICPHCADLLSRDLDELAAPCTRSPEITGPIHTDGRPMPAAEQPAATGKHVTSTHVIPARVILMGMNMSVSLPMMLL